MKKTQEPQAAAMSSNYKSKPSQKESPAEPFKRAVAGCLRAIAKRPEMEIAFAAERPGLIGGKVRLPEPPRKLTKGEAAIVRGHADSVALKLACHDPNVHRKLIPGGQQARAVFDAVEQARVEAIGARRMSGVAKNLTAMLDDKFHRGKFDEITDRADAPIEEAVAMMVRERLTGQAPPAAAKKLVDLWRPIIENKAGRGLDRLEYLIEDQARFGDAIHDLLDSLDMGEDRNEIPRKTTTPSRARTTAARTRTARRARRRTPKTCSACRSNRRSVRRRCPGGRRRGHRRAEFGHVRRRRHGRFRNPVGAVASARRPQRASRAGIRRFRFEIRRDRSRPRISATPAELDRCAPSSTSSLPTCRARSARLANRLQRRLMAQQNRAWEFDLEEGIPRSAPGCRASSSIRCSRCPSSARRTPPSATRW
jgi:cobaltochelatase CobT